MKRARRTRGGWIAPKASTSAQITTSTTWAASTAEGTGGDTEAGGMAAMGGGGGGQDYSFIGDMVEQGRDGWYASVLDQQKQLGNDPCQFALAIYQTWEQFGRAPLRNVLAAANKVSGALILAVQRSIHDWGYASTEYTGSTPFGLYLLNTGAVDLSIGRAAAVGLSGGPWGAGIFDGAVDANLRNKLPVPGKVPSNKPYGFEISPGSFLYDPSGSTYDDDLFRGKLQGPRIRDSYDAWKKGQTQSVSPGAFPDARNQLGNWVGGDPTNWYIWKEGQRITDGSKAGGMLKAESEMWEMEGRAKKECKARRRWNERQALLEREAAERSEIRGAGTERERLIALVAVGAVLAWGFKR